MTKKKRIFCLAILMVFSIVKTTYAQVSRPAVNSETGFFVMDGKLYDASGSEFSPIGANTAVFWQLRHTNWISS